MGGNTYNRRHFTDEEINELVRQVDGTKGLFDDRIFETEKQWRANISRHLDADSCQRFYFLLEKIHHCKGCGVMLIIFPGFANIAQFVCRMENLEKI